MNFKYLDVLSVLLIAFAIPSCALCTEPVNVLPSFNFLRESLCPNAYVSCAKLSDIYSKEEGLSSQLRTAHFT